MTTLLHQMTVEAALARPDAAAARCAGDELTYMELVRSSNGLAAVLADAGVARRDRVAVLLGKGLRVPVSFYGTLAAGAALVPIDPRSPAEQVARILHATDASHLVTEPARMHVVRQALGACPEITHLIGVDIDDDIGCTTISWSDVASEARDAPPPVATIDLDPSYILHTSGSTGTPKLILHTHRSAMAFVDWAVGEYELVSSDRLSNHSSHHTCFATFDYYAAARVEATSRRTTSTPSDGFSSPVRASRASTFDASWRNFRRLASATSTAPPRSTSAPATTFREPATAPNRCRSEPPAPRPRCSLSTTSCAR
jgi:acyl-CoA synthetase (AMP-forming)/AMP-acid ligase II